MQNIRGTCMQWQYQQLPHAHNLVAYMSDVLI